MLQRREKMVAFIFGLFLFQSAAYGQDKLATAKVAPAKPAIIKAGIIGLDTSHVVAFTNAMNDPKAKGLLAEITVVAAFRGGSPDIAASRDRIDKFTKQLSDKGIVIVDSIDELLEKVDVILLESVDGRPHWNQAKKVILAGKPLFIDKPLAGDLADAIAIFKLAAMHKVPCFSSSSLRFSPGILGMRNDPTVGKVLGCVAYSPCSLEPHHPDLFWYGIHGVETLFTIMGPGCQSVSRVHNKDVDVVTGEWTDNRVGTYRGIRRGRTAYGALVFGDKGIKAAGKYAGYQPLLEEIVKFFKTGKPPVTAEETLQIYAFMQAADESKKQGGRSVSIQELMKKASAAADEKIRSLK